MKREAKILLEKACDSLVLSIEIFNRPNERGRIATTLILLDHAFEMLLKAGIIKLGGNIKEKDKGGTIGFDACVRRAVTDAKINFLTQEQALVLQTINGLRDAAQHHLLEISEAQLYMHSQSGVTLFRDILNKVFGIDISEKLPKRVLPISTIAPVNMTTFFQTEIEEIKKLLAPGKRRHIEAQSRLRPLAILDSSIRGNLNAPNQKEIKNIEQQILDNIPWAQIFVGVSSVEFSTTGQGPFLNLRIHKKEGVPVQLVPEGTPGAAVVAIKRVNELDFYSLGRDDVAKHIGLSGPKTTAVIRFLKLDKDQQYFKEFIIGKTRLRRYSQKTVEKIKEEMPKLDLKAIWKQHGIIWGNRKETSN